MDNKALLKLLPERKIELELPPKPPEAAPGEVYFPKAALHAKNKVSPAAFILYVIMWDYQGQADAFTTEIECLAVDIHKSPKQTQRLLYELEQARWIAITKKQGQTSEYRCLIPETFGRESDQAPAPQPPLQFPAKAKKGPKSKR